MRRSVYFPEMRKILPFLSILPPVCVDVAASVVCSYAHGIAAAVVVEHAVKERPFGRPTRLSILAQLTLDFPGRRLAVSGD